METLHLCQIKQAEHLAITTTGVFEFDGAGIGNEQRQGAWIDLEEVISGSGLQDAISVDRERSQGMGEDTARREWHQAIRLNQGFGTGEGVCDCGKRKTS